MSVGQDLALMLGTQPGNWRSTKEVCEEARELEELASRPRTHRPNRLEGLARTFQTIPVSRKVELAAMREVFMGVPIHMSALCSRL